MTKHLFVQLNLVKMSRLYVFTKNNHDQSDFQNMAIIMSSGLFETMILQQNTITKWSYQMFMSEVS